MGRTSIEIDDEVIAAVMRDTHPSTKHEAVDLALRQARLRSVNPRASDVTADPRHLQVVS